MTAKTWLWGGWLALGLAGSVAAQPAPAPGTPAPAAAGAPAVPKAPPAPRRKAPPPKAVDLSPTIATLASDNIEDAAKAADALGASAEPTAHDALLDALAFGLPAAVATRAIDALVAHPAPPDVVALRRYADHHDPAVRGSALGALAHYPDPAAHAAIVARLHDPVGLVRGAAAAAAAKGRVKDAIEPLFALLERGEEPAARALAALADDALSRRIGDELGKVPEPTLALALGLVLKRADFGPDPARVEVVRALSKIADKAALDALTDYLDATPKNPPRPSRAEAKRIVDARIGGGK